MLGNKRKNPEIDTLVGRNTRVSGDIQFRGGFHVDGYIKGNVVAEHDTPSVLSISENGTVEGTVSVPHVVLQRSRMGESSRPFLPTPVALIASDPMP